MTPREQAEALALKWAQLADDAGPTYEDHARMGPCAHGQYRGCLRCGGDVLLPYASALLAARQAMQAYLDSTQGRASGQQPIKKTRTALSQLDALLPREGK